MTLRYSGHRSRSGVVRLGTPRVAGESVGDHGESLAAGHDLTVYDYCSPA